MALTFATDIVPDGNKTRNVGSSSKKFKLNGHVAELIEVSVTATSSTSTSVSNQDITADHVVLNDSQFITSDISWTTSSGSIALSCADGIPAMTLYLGIKA